MKSKYLVGILTLALASTVAFSSQAQEKKSVGEKIENTADKVGNKTADVAGKVGHKTANVAGKVGHKTAEVAVKGAAKVNDQTYKGKKAPDGTNVYIDKDNKKYYVNSKGAKVYLKASQIRNKMK
jgi:hypothetical protein